MEDLHLINQTNPDLMLRTFLCQISLVTPLSMSKACINKAIFQARIVILLQVAVQDMRAAIMLQEIL